MKELWHMSSDRSVTRLVLLECGGNGSVAGSEAAGRFKRAGAKHPVPGVRRFVLLSGGRCREAARREDPLAGSSGGEPDGAA